MGFLVKTKFHPKKIDGSFGFDTEQSLEKSFKVGKKEEDISHESLALVILKQLARRDIYVVDVEVEEYVKKIIKVKESTNGIIIGHKRYSFDNASEAGDVIAEEVEPIKQSPPPLPVKPSGNYRKEFLDPGDDLTSIMQSTLANLRLTRGRPYSIISDHGDKYRVINDIGKTVEVPMMLFSATPPARMDLAEHESVPMEAAEGEVNLSYPGEIRGEAPSLR